MDDSALLLGQLAVMALMGAICAAIANGRGRNPLGWFFIGVVAPCLGLILVLVLADLKKESEIKMREKRSRSKIQEELTQERMKNQAFRGHASNRLDAHDEHLGVDTRTTAGGTLPPPPVPQELAGGIPSVGWYIVFPGMESEGPFSLPEMRERLTANQVTEKTLVWHESLEDWMPAAASPLHIFLS